MGKKIMISLPDELLDDIDAAAREEGRTRSELIREASRLYLAKHAAKRKRPIDDPRIVNALKTMDRIAKKIDAHFDSTKAVRKMRDSR